MLTLLAGVVAMNGRIAQNLKANTETASATHSILDRTERIRSLTWSDLTNANAIAAVFSAPTATAPRLSALSEEITVSTYPPASGAPQIRVSRSSSGAVTINESGAGLSTQAAVRATLRSTWTGAPSGRSRFRMAETILYQEGLAR